MFSSARSFCFWCLKASISFQRSCSRVVATELKKASTQGFKKSRLADKVRINVKGGSGGQGCPSAGGIGGKGGSVFVKCAKGASLMPYTLRQNKRVVAGHGQNFTKNKFKAAPGKDVYLSVPPGTEIRSGNYELITDLNKSGEVVKIANGGVGGSARSIDFNGAKGERKNVVFELKTIADVAMAGFPNAGKSSLLRALSRARPKVGDYPFTTINPMVGSIFYTNGRQITVADLPGLIEDAHLNKGMGHKFLRHIERTKVIALVVDVNGFDLKTSQRTPLDNVILLLKELALYNEVLLSRPFLLIVNKMDVKDAKYKLETMLQGMVTADENHVLLREQLYADDVIKHLRNFTDNNYENILPVSAINGDGLSTLQEHLYDSVPEGAEASLLS